ncbi:hypothetical protein QPX11_05185 [Corynebacterium propinquum]|uniref:hypothetical protein n=1 Tax=Corynebacterium propinquum TaxID=43769 RepID=UPI002543D625|nr:hypothetical protein [Corynebacterium propinquum]MDK4251733.1 hypothetical protein [Corynebacterium propinquum]
MGLSLSFNVDNATLADLQELVAMAEHIGIASDTYVEFDEDSRHVRVDSDGMSASKVAEIQNNERARKAERLHGDGVDDLDEIDDGDEVDYADARNDAGAHRRQENQHARFTHPRDGGEWSDVFDLVTRTVNNNPVTQHIGDAAMRSLGDILSGRRNPPRH